MDYGMMPDEGLMLRFYLGADRAFGVLCERYVLVLVGFALRLLPPGLPGAAKTAEDLAQEALLHVLRSRANASGARWDAVRPVRPWLFRILFNLVMTFLRSPGNRGFVRPVSVVGPVSAGEDPVRLQDVLTDVDLSPLAQLLQGELLDALSGCIDSLPEPDRSVVVLWMHGMKQKDIALILDLSDSDVSRIKVRAFARLVVCLRGKHVLDESPI